MKLGAILRELRNRRQWTGQTLSERAGISTATLKNIELGYRSPQANTLMSIIKALAERAPLTMAEARDLAAASNIDAAVLAPYVHADPASVSSNRQQCEILLAELLRGVDPGAVATVLQAMIALRDASPRAYPVRTPKAAAPGSAPGPAHAPAPDQPRHVRVLVEEGPMPGVPGATQKLYRAYPIAQAVLAESLSASLDLPAARIADAIAKATRAS